MLSFVLKRALNIHSISVRCGPEDILQGPQESSRKSSYTVMRDLDSLSQYTPVAKLLYICYYADELETESDDDEQSSL